MAKVFDVEFNHYIKDGEFEKVPQYKGIYLFRLTEKKNNKLFPTVVYIGVADGDTGLNGRINDKHEHLQEARELVKKEKKKGKDVFLTISYSSKKIENDDYWRRIEAALIYSKKPVLNVSNTFSFNYPKTTIRVSGTRHLDLDSLYIVDPVQK